MLYCIKLYRHTVAEVREDYAYCYTRPSCFGDKPEGMQAVVKKDECCQWRGRGWGLQGRRCEQCPDSGMTDFNKTDYSEDKLSGDYDCFITSVFRAISECY